MGAACHDCEGCTWSIGKAARSHWCGAEWGARPDAAVRPARTRCAGGRACAVRKAGDFGPVFSDGRGDCSDYCVMLRTTQIRTSGRRVIPHSPPPKDKKGLKVGGRAARSTPKKQSPAPNQTENVVMENHKKEPPNLMVSKVAATTHRWCSRGGAAQQTRHWIPPAQT